MAAVNFVVITNGGGVRLLEQPISTNSVPRAFFPRVAIGCRLLGGDLIGGGTCPLIHPNYFYGYGGNSQLYLVNAKQGRIKTLGGPMPKCHRGPPFSSPLLPSPALSSALPSPLPLPPVPSSAISLPSFYLLSFRSGHLNTGLGAL